MNKSSKIVEKLCCKAECVRDLHKYEGPTQVRRTCPSTKASENQELQPALIRKSQGVRYIHQPSAKSHAERMHGNVRENRRKEEN